jgi:cytochrome P450
VSDVPTIHFDHWDHDFSQDPFPTYRRMRSECPVAHSDAHGGFWVVSRYGLVDEITHRPEVFSSRYVSVPRDIGFGDLPLPPLNLDPPVHTRVKRLLTPAFSPPRVAELQPVTQQIARDLIAKFENAGRCDASLDFAKSVPIAVLCRMFALAPEEEDRFVDWVHRIIERGGQDHEDAVKAGLEMWQYFTELLGARRSHPGDDLMSNLALAEIEGERLTDDEILGSAVVLLLAGIDTTWSTLGSAMWHLARNPADRRRLVEESELMTTAVEEMLRAFAPTSIGRMVKSDTEFHGAEFHEGDMMLLPLVCANRDEEEFSDSEEIVLDRQPNRHFAFGVGIHRCLGANLARMELRVALEEFLARIPEFELAPGEEVAWATGPIRGARSVPIVFPPR